MPSYDLEEETRNQTTNPKIKNPHVIPQLLLNLYLTPHNLGNQKVRKIVTEITEEYA